MCQSIEFYCICNRINLLHMQYILTENFFHFLSHFWRRNWRLSGRHLGRHLERHLWHHYRCHLGLHLTIWRSPLWRTERRHFFILTNQFLAKFSPYQTKKKKEKFLKKRNELHQELNSVLLGDIPLSLPQNHRVFVNKISISQEFVSHFNILESEL